MSIKTTLNLGLVFLFHFSFGQHIFQKVALEMETRSATGGKSTQTKATIYYTAEGRMVSYYSLPQELVIVNNKKGEITIYNPIANTVVQDQNHMLGTETTQLYFFLENKKNDLGLSAMGYSLRSTRFEEGLKITEWNPPMAIAKEIQKVELVHEKGNPIFMGYHAANGLTIKKTFFYNYNSVSEYISMPTTITQIDFKSVKDSVVTKTTYSQFKLNQQVPDDKIHFTIPASAKIVGK